MLCDQRRQQCQRQIEQQVHLSVQPSANEQNLQPVLHKMTPGQRRKLRRKRNKSRRQALESDDVTSDASRRGGLNTSPRIMNDRCNVSYFPANLSRNPLELGENQTRFKTAVEINSLLESIVRYFATFFVT